MTGAMEGLRGADPMLSDRYTLERRLARGGMGSLWLARDSRLERRVAVKLIESAALPTEELRVRFEREAIVVAKLKSPHIVQIHDYGFDRGIAYIVMELLEGEDLRQRLARIPWLPLADVRTIVAQVGKALDYIHAQGIVHRDLKPGNVFLANVGGEELVKVIDFGIVRTAGTARQVTDARCVLGTPRYMSPEQLLRPKDVDRRSDLWALAVMAYRALTGRFPYAGESPAELAESLRAGHLVPATRVAPELSPRVDAFFARALALAPEDRYASAAELAAAFDKLAPRVKTSTIQFGTTKKMLASLPGADGGLEGTPFDLARLADDPALQITVKTDRPPRPRPPPPAPVEPAPLPDPAPLAAAEVGDHPSPTDWPDPLPPVTMEDSYSWLPPPILPADARSRRRWIAAGVLVVAAIAGGVAVRPLDGRPGRDAPLDKEASPGAGAPAAAPSGGGTTGEPATSAAPAVPATVAPSSSTVAPLGTAPVRKLRPIVKPTRPEDPYVDLPASDGFSTRR
jgi:serine/threonine protein kinase